LDAYQLPIGALIVREPTPAATGAALSARVSSAKQKDALTLPCIHAGGSSVS